jgi:hypothetical protein
MSLCRKYISVNVRGLALELRDLLPVVWKAFDPRFAFNLFSGTVPLHLCHPDSERMISPLPVNLSTRRDEVLIFFVLRPHLYLTHSFIHSVIPYSVLRKVHILFQNKFFTECDLVLPLLIYSIFSFLEGQPVDT